MSERTDRDRQMAEEAHYSLLRLLEQQPQLSQREIAEELGVSLGKVNYCVRALVEKGLLKVGNFYRSNNKPAYLYVLTPRGLAEKAAMTIRFLRRKEEEHQALFREIEALKKEVSENSVDGACE